MTIVFALFGKRDAMPTMNKENPYEFFIKIIFIVLFKIKQDKYFVCNKLIII